MANWQLQLKLIVRTTAVGGCELSSLPRSVSYHKLVTAEKLSRFVSQIASPDFSSDLCWFDTCSHPDPPRWQIWCEDSMCWRLDARRSLEDCALSRDREWLGWLLCRLSPNPPWQFNGKLICLRWKISNYIKVGSSPKCQMINWMKFGWDQRQN